MALGLGCSKGFSDFRFGGIGGVGFGGVVRVWGVPRVSGFGGFRGFREFCKTTESDRACARRQAYDGVAGLGLSDALLLVGPRLHLAL